MDGHRLGAEDAAIREAIGVVFQDHLLDPLLTVEENIRCAAGCTPATARRWTRRCATRRRPRTSGIFSAAPTASFPAVRSAARISPARWCTHPRILFLDEPTTGLDPQTRKSVWDSIRVLQRETGLTVFLTTHYMEEAAEADYVVVIDAGPIAARGTPTELKDRYAGDQLKLSPADRTGLLAALRAMQVDFTLSGERVAVRLNGTMDALPLLDELKGYLAGFEVLGGTMDDAFIGITGKEIRS